MTSYANGGSLVDLLTATSAPLPWRCRVSLAHDIIRGLGHLHEHNLIHRDLSSQNILIRVNHECLSPWCHDSLDADSSPPSTAVAAAAAAMPMETDSCLLRIDQMTELWEPGTAATVGLPKVSPSVAPASAFQNRCFQHLPPPYTAVVGDLGVCLDLRQPNVDATIIAGSAYCTAPECLRKTAPYTPAADIFAFGLLVCELIARLVNNGVTIPRTKDFGLDEENLPVPAHCPAWFFELAVDCCSVDHTKRPSAEEIIARIAKNSNFIGSWVMNFDKMSSTAQPASTATETVHWVPLTWKQ